MARYFKCELNKPALSYKCGENIRFEITARERCQNIYCKYVHWELRTDDGKKLNGLGSCSAEYPLVIETTLERPGFAHLVCRAMDQSNEPDGSFEQLDAGAGADVEKIEYHDTIPEDFYDYWKSVEELIANTKAEVLMCKEWQTSQKGFKTYDIRVKTPEGRPASFIVTIPEGDKKCSMKVIFIGYGAHPAYPHYNEGVITAVINPHGIENDLPSVELAEKYKDELYVGYGFSDEENKSNMTTYWRGMVIRALMAVKYLKTIEEWDGETIILAGGSQGAFQAASVAAHTDGITLLQLDIPGFCDFGGKNMGYLRDWQPEYAQGLRYYDVVAQSKFIKCPVTITASLGDYICPPSGVMALYNNIETEKHLTFTQAATHGYRPHEWIQFAIYSGQVQKGKYRHFKGNEYEVLDIGYDSERAEELVIYKALYGEGKIWIRKKSEFCGIVERDGKVFKRFEFIG